MTPLATLTFARQSPGALVTRGGRLTARTLYIYEAGKL